jgi:glucose/arabinose dehydrogenase
MPLTVGDKLGPCSSPPSPRSHPCAQAQQPAAAPGGGSRIVFGRDGMVYMNVSAGGDPPAPASMTAQDPGSLQGKVLRLRDDGTHSAR